MKMGKGLGGRGRGGRGAHIARHIGLVPGLETSRKAVIALWPSCAKLGAISYVRELLTIHMEIRRWMLEEWLNCGSSGLPRHLILNVSSPTTGGNRVRSAASTRSKVLT